MPYKLGLPGDGLIGVCGKIVVVTSGDYPLDIDGIEIVNVIDFLLRRS